MGLKMEYTGDDGRKYNSLAEMMSAEKDKMLDALVTDVERAISAQRCSVHGQSASATVRRRGDQISFDINGCCDDLVEKAERAAESATR